MTSEIATALARRWQAAPRRISCVSRGGNLVYRFEAGTDRFYLRVIKPEVRPLELVAGAVDWQRYLHQRNAPVAEPLASADGHVLEVVSEDGLRRLATVTREVQGERIDFTNLSDVAAWAACIGQIHQASEGYRPSMVNTSTGSIKGELPTLPRLWEQIRSAVTADPLLRFHFDHGSRWIGQLSEPALVTHADARPGNALISDRGVTMIDFDEPTVAWPAYDLARMMLDDNGTPPANAAAHLTAILNGYRIDRPNIAITPEEVSRFVTIRALLMYAWSLEDGETDAAWLQRLRCVLEHSVDSRTRTATS